MATKDEFKLFASKHPELVKFVKNGDASWQKFYEIFDIYGEDENAWQDYFSKQSVNVSNEYNLKNLADKIKNIDLNSIQEHINTAQKALGIVQELTNKGSGEKIVSEVIKPRPINKIFED